MKVIQEIQSNNAAEFYAQQDDVFGRIAGRYPLLCDLFSFGIHRLWKQRVAAIIAKEGWSQLLDCATGTGGKTGRALIRALSKIESVCAFVHREESVSVVKSLGAANVIVGDMRDHILAFICPFQDQQELHQSRVGRCPLPQGWCLDNRE